MQGVTDEMVRVSGSVLSLLGISDKDIRQMDVASFCERMARKGLDPLVINRLDGVPMLTVRYGEAA